MALVLDENGSLVRNTSPSRVFREDYRNHGIISYAEAADYAGVSVGTIRRWVSKKKGPLPVIRRAGALRIALLDLDKFLRKGSAR